MTNTVGFHLYEVPRIDKLIEEESRMVVARSCQGGNGELVLMGTEFQFWETKIFCGWVVVMAVQHWECT